MEKNIKHILNNGAEHDGQECEYTMCYSGDHKVKDKCLGWCDKVSPPNNLSNNMEKNNEILAEFMELTFADNGLYGHGVKYWSGLNLIGRCGAKTEDLEYNTSWNWFHPVWEKFRDLKFEILSEEKSKHNKICTGIMRKITHGTLPEAYEELAKGIMWYNSIKEK